MKASSTRLEGQKTGKAEILKQIAILQAQLVGLPVSGNQNLNPLSPKRKQPDASFLAPPTPSPKKRRLNPDSKQKADPSSSGRTSLALGRSQADIPPTNPAPSTVLTKLASLHKRSVDATPFETIVRSSSFSERLNASSMPEQTSQGILGASMNILSDDTEINAPKRDERLALVEDLEVGPVEHKPPFDDPLFEQFEPNSGIRLKSRVIAHEDIQEYLRGRYYLSPPRLYSVIRPLPDKQGFDVPVAGDFVTIAVVAERGPIKFTRAPIGVGGEEDDDRNGQCSATEKADTKQDQKMRGKWKPESAAKSSGKKYVNIKLVDFGARARSSSFATGAKAIIRGDAFLSLLLFESDSFDTATRDGGKPERVYKGGSRGAFEALSKLKEGDVIALLNPKILKPFQRSADAPHPVNNILALTPESASSIVVIGRARDLGMCTAIKRDGKVCGAWCDKRISNVCDWHVQHAVERRRSGRPEFSIGTSGMSTSSAPKRKPVYDPVRQWGLKPEENSTSGATYVVAGHIISGSGFSDSMHIAETMGREGQAKAKRKLIGKDTDRALKALLDRDKEGMKAVVRAREVATKYRQEGDKKTEVGSGLVISPNEDAVAQVNSPPNQKNSYSAEVIKQLGFDPAAKPGQRRDSLMAKKKLETLAAIHSSRKEIELGPKPRQRIRAGVFAPRLNKQLLAHPVTDIPGSERNNGALNESLPVGGMIDLDGSDAEL